MMIYEKSNEIICELDTICIVTSLFNPHISFKSTCRNIDRCTVIDTDIDIICLSVSST